MCFIAWEEELNCDKRSPEHNKYGEFFDRVNHDVLKLRLKRKIPNNRFH